MGGPLVSSDLPWTWGPVSYEYGEGTEGVPAGALKRVIFGDPFSLTRYTDFLYDSGGRLRALRDEDGYETRIRIDERGDLVIAQSPEGDFRVYLYDEAHRLRAVIGDLGFSDLIQYNDEGMVAGVSGMRGFLRAAPEDTGRLLDRLAPDAGLPWSPLSGYVTPVLVGLSDYLEDLCDTPWDSDDGDPCTYDECDSTVGCRHIAMSVCGWEPGPGTCCTYDPVGCLMLSADPACPVGYVPEGSPCDDGVECTVGDRCDGMGHCVAGAAMDTLCDTGSGCVAGRCVAGLGCRVESVDNACPAFEADFAEIVAAEPASPFLTTAQMDAWHSLYLAWRRNYQPIGPRFRVRWDEITKTPMAIEGLDFLSTSPDVAAAMSEFQTRYGAYVDALYSMRADDTFDTEVETLYAPWQRSVEGWVVRMGPRRHRDLLVEGDHIHFHWIAAPEVNPAGLVLTEISSSILRDAPKAYREPSARLGDEALLSMVRADTGATEAECLFEPLISEVHGVHRTIARGECLLDGHRYRLDLDATTGEVLERRIRGASAAPQILIRVGLPHMRFTGNPLPHPCNGIANQGDLDQKKIWRGLPNARIYSSLECVNLWDPFIIDNPCYWEGADCNDCPGSPNATNAWGVVIPPETIPEPGTPEPPARYVDFTGCGFFDDVCFFDRSAVPERYWTLPVPTPVPGGYDIMCISGYTQSNDPDDAVKAFRDRNLVGRRAETFFHLNRAKTLFRTGYGWGVEDLHFEVIPTGGWDGYWSVDRIITIWLKDGANDSDSMSDVDEAAGFRNVLYHEFGHHLQDANGGLINAIGYPLDVSLPNCSPMADWFTTESSCFDEMFAYWVASILGQYEAIISSVPGSEFVWPKDYNPDGSKYETAKYIIHNLLSDHYFRVGPRFLITMKAFLEEFGRRDSLHILCDDPVDLGSCKGIGTLPSPRFPNAIPPGLSAFQVMLEADAAVNPPEKRQAYEISRVFHQRIADGDPGRYENGAWSDFDPSEHPDPATIQRFPWADDATNRVDNGGFVVATDGCGDDTRFSPTVWCDTEEAGKLPGFPTTPQQTPRLTLGYPFDRDVFSFVGRKGMRYLIGATAVHPFTVPELRLHPAGVTDSIPLGPVMPGEERMVRIFEPASTGLYRMVVSPGISYGWFPPVPSIVGPMAEYRLHVGVSGDRERDVPSAAAPLGALEPLDPTAPVPGPGMKTRFITSPRDEDWYYFVVPHALQSVTLKVLSDFSAVGGWGRYWRVKVWVMGAGAITSDLQFPQGNPDLVLDGAAALANGLEVASGEVGLPVGDNGVPRGVYYVRVRGECTGPDACPGPCSTPFPYYLWLSNPVSADAMEPPEPGNTPEAALDLDEMCAGTDCQATGSPVFRFPTMIGNSVPTSPTGQARGSGLIEVEDMVGSLPGPNTTSDEDWFRVLVDEGEIINIWLTGGDCHPSDPSTPASLSVAWMAGPAENRAIYWANHEWVVNQSTIYGETVALLTESIEVDGNESSRAFPRSATLSFTNPAGHRDSEGKKRPAPIWIRVKMEEGDRRCGYRLGIERPGATDRPFMTVPAPGGD